MRDAYASSDYIRAGGVTATADSSVAGHGPALAADDNPLTWFGSGSSGSSASLQLDVGSAGPFYDELTNITVFNRCAALQCVSGRLCCSWL
jgi:hypothetical protein